MIPPESLMSAEISRSVAPAAGSATSNVLVVVPRSRLPLIEAIVAELAAVTSPASVSTPVSVVTVPPTSVSPAIVSSLSLRSSVPALSTSTVDVAANWLLSVSWTVPSATSRAPGMAVASSVLLRSSVEPSFTVVVPR